LKKKAGGRGGVLTGLQEMMRATVPLADQAGDEYVEKSVFSRRTMFAGLFATAAIGSVETSASPRARIEKAVDDLSVAMSAMHGETCWVHIDHERGVAAVSLLRR
jgi:hypothetical protein